MPGDREGPELTYSCYGCRFHEVEREYVPESDETDHYYYCNHPTERKSIGYSLTTPGWCPELKREK